MNHEIMKKIQSLFAECLVSFIFGFAVYSSILGSTITDQLAGPTIVGLTLGFSGVALIYAFSDLTVSHFNPAITLSAIITLKLDPIMGILYILMQYIGFILAVCAVLPCFPGTYKEIVNTIRPKKSTDEISNSILFCTEFFLTGILVYVAFSVGVNPYKPTVNEEGEVVDGDNEKPADRKTTAPLAIGLTLGFLGFLGIASSGGAFNPALTFAPSLMSGTWTDLWLYVLGQYGGGITGALLQVLILTKIL